MDIRERMALEQHILLARKFLLGNLNNEELRVFCESVLEALNKLNK